MFKTQNTFERVKLSRQLEETFLSLYDPEKKLSPLNSLRTIRRIMNRMICVIKHFIEVVRNNSILSSIVPSYYEDDLKFIDALFEALRKTNIKLAFTPSKVPPKEYDNMGVLYYQGQDIEKEDPMIVENADDYIYTPTLDSENKDPLPSTAEQTTKKPDGMRESYKELQDRFTRKFNELYYPEEFTKEGNPKSFWGIIDSLQAGINYARNCMESSLKENHSEDDFSLCEYYAKVLDTYLRTVDELNLGILFVSDCDVRKPWSERNPMIVENADDYIYTPTLNSESKDPLPSTKKKTIRKHYEDMLISIIHHALRCGDIKKEYTNSEDDMDGLNADDKMYGLNADDKVDPIKLDEDWVSNVKEYLKDKERKVSHPDEDILIRITKLIFGWCETAGIDPSSAKYHIIAELYSMMRRFVMLKKPEEKREENTNE